MYAFSDGSPAEELAVASLILAACVLVSYLHPISIRLDRTSGWVAARLRQVGLFNDNTVRGEIYALDLLRIPLAFLLLLRFGTDLYLHLLSGQNILAAWTGLGLILDVALMVGLAAPVAALALGLLLNIIIDNFTFNPSLGSMIVAICLIPMIVAPVGYSVSLDAVLMARPSRIGRALHWLYAFWGRPTVDRIQVGRFLCLVAYWAISAYSALKHVDAPTWNSGFTTGFLLISPIINPGSWMFFQSFYEHFPVVYVLFSYISTFGMMAWQLLLVPLVLISKWTRLFAVVWGVLFFVFSAQVLAIKTLGDYEYVLWAIVFWNRLRTFLEISFDRLADRLYVRGWAARFHLQSWKLGRVASHDNFFFGVMLGFVVLFTAYLLRFPLVDRMGAGAAQVASRNIVGQGTLVFGLGPIDVFNELDLSVYRNGSDIFIHHTGGEVEKIDWATEWSAESQGSLLTVQARRLALQPVFCGVEMTRTIIDVLRDNSAAGSPRRNASIEVDYIRFSRPSAADFKAMRFHPWTGEKTCRVRGRMDGKDELEVDYYPAGRRALESYGIPADFTGRDVRLAGRFPCDQEVARAIYWFDLGPDARGAAEVGALRNLFSAQASNVFACFTAYHKLAQIVELERYNEAVLPRTRCAHDLASARAFVAALRGEPILADAERDLVAAEQAEVRNDVGQCLIRSAAVRGHYTNAFLGKLKRQKNETDPT